MLKFGFLLFSTFVIGNGYRTSAKSYPGGRIVGGNDTDIADFPFMLQLRDSDNNFGCGASLIASNWAVTAAHCVNRLAPADFILVANTTNLSETNEMVRLEISQVVPHENFSYAPFDNDIALLQIGTPVNCTNCKPVSIAQTGPNEGENATIAGWGTTAPFLPASDILQVIYVPIIDHAKCAQAYNDTTKVTENMICAGDFVNGGKDSCKGDSGGPLLINGSLGGIVSWGSSCGKLGFPGVYTRVASYLEWIKYNTGLADL